METETEPERAAVVRRAAADRQPFRMRTASVPTTSGPVSYTHLRAHETVLDLVCRLLLEKKTTITTTTTTTQTL